jgi:hypothetical protein
MPYERLQMLIRQGLDSLLVFTFRFAILEYHVGDGAEHRRKGYHECDSGYPRLGMDVDVAN